MPALNWMDVAASGAGDARVPDEAGLLEGLNESQRRAVLHGEGPLLILAGAGTGKTRTITRRLAWLVATGRADARGVLAITFTNKAAREMRERVEELLPTSGMWIATFHSACARVLRRDIELLEGYTRDFTIVDSNDKKQLLKELVKELGYAPERFRPALLSGWISNVKTNAHSPEDAEEALGFEDEVLAKLRFAYEDRMRAQNQLDFDDLLLKVLEIFDRFPGVRDTYAHQFRYVLVDEYQDTNRVQYLLARHFASAWGNIAVCGDPDQSIYSWRGADIRNILDFEQDFGDATVVKLEQNYRSTRNVLAAAQGLIRNSSERKEKELYSSREDGPHVRVVQCSDEVEEAEWIAREVKRLVDAGVRKDEIAVLYRVHFMQRVVERALRDNSITYRVAGGLEFYERREIKDLLAYLQLLVNPRSDLATRRAINVPPRGIGDTSVDRLVQWAADRRVPLTRAIASEEARALIRGRARKGLEAFAQLLDLFEGAAQRPPHQVLGRLVEELEWFDYVHGLDEKDGTTRVENVEEFLASVERFENEREDATLTDFLADVALVSDLDHFGGSDEREPKAAEEGDGTGAVTLMTLHSAKGLEFDAVFLPGLEEELLPHARALEDDAGGVDEERRLLYVGMTRAREHLALSHTQSRTYFGTNTWREPSRFLDELPRDVVEGAGVEEEDDTDVLGEFEPEYGGGLSEGDWVVHPSFGAGLVERLVGSGQNARATVTFRGAGTKVLLLAYAKLEPMTRGDGR
ncbi:MAG: UvrD-helicase domain-containing protein [Planctomycetota bacterium]